MSPDDAVPPNVAPDETVPPQSDSAPPAETLTMEPPAPSEGGTPPGETTTGTSDSDGPKRSPWMWVAIALGVLLVIVAAYYFMTANKTVAVPNVVGRSQTDATKALNDAGLKLGNVTTVASDTSPEGQVVSQSPVAGREVDSGTGVDLVVSGGRSTVSVPDVVGKDVEEAKQTLGDLGLTVATSDQYDEAQAAGTVLAQVPEAGSEALPGDTVAIVVSKGKAPAKAAVPDVVGKSQADAEKALTSAGFEVALIEAYSVTVKKGVVGAQVPEGGTNVNPGSEVEIFVSLGEGVASITVPDVSAWPKSEAVDALEAAGLYPKVYRTVQRHGSQGVRLRAGAHGRVYDCGRLAGGHRGIAREGTGRRQCQRAERRRQEFCGRLDDDSHRWAATCRGSWVLRGTLRHGGGPVSRGRLGGASRVDRALPRVQGPQARCTRGEVGHR